MLKQMMAEIIFRNPGDMNPAIADLIGFDFEVRVLDDWIDDDGPAVWIVATTLSGLSQSAFSGTLPSRWAATSWKPAWPLTTWRHG